MPVKNNGLPFRKT